MPTPMLQKFTQALRLRRALLLVWQSSHRWTVASVVVLIVQGLLPLAALYVMKLTVDAVAAGVRAADKDAALHHVIVLVLVAGMIALLTAVLDSIEALVSEA